MTRFGESEAGGPVTAGRQEDAAPGAAQAAAAAHGQDAERHRISVSTTAIEAASTPDDHGVGWFGEPGIVGGVSVNR